MRVFISWSGERSGNVARSIADWLPYLLPSVKTWVSSHDINPGARWATELTAELAGCQFGIVCLTRRNLHSPWILFEAGSLAKQFDVARVVPYLIDINPADVEYPLAQFQSVNSTAAGTSVLVQSINSRLDDPMPGERLQKAFDKWWPDLEEKLGSFVEADVLPASVRSEREILEELLEIVRHQHRVGALPISVATAPEARAGRRGIRVLIFWHEQGLNLEYAKALGYLLEKNGMTPVLVEHRDPAEPDSVFIGALVGAEDARLVLTSIPYAIRYIFRSDYPLPQGGDDSGLTIGIGYMSAHLQDSREEASKPVQISEEDLGRLTDPSISNTTFQALLRELTWRTRSELVRNA